MNATRVADIEVHGAGPAGAAAAIAARLAGAAVDLYDPSPFPRHKVCGEFLSPEALPILKSIGLDTAFLDLAPARYTELVLQFGARTIRSPLPEPAFGLSRYAFDQLLVERSLSLGVRLHRERADAPESRPAVVAYGRQAPAAALSVSNTTRRGNRLFGFKAHFNGIPADPLTLFFAGPAYVGINRIENGMTNVCGIATESALRQHAFDIDAYLDSVPRLRILITRLTRKMSWMTTGPLSYNQRFQPSGTYQYPAGDALSFIDPFTGSGLLCALLTGHLAGIHAIRGISPRQYLARCRRTLRRPFWAATAFRMALATPFAATLAAHVPAAWLFRGTRPTANTILFKI